MRKKILIVVMVLMIVTAFAPVQAHAAPRQLNTTLYDGVIKSGYTVYVSGTEGIYKVWLNKNGSVKRSRLLRAAQSYGGYPRYHTMKKQGQYIYATEVDTSSRIDFVRINVTNGKRKWLARSMDEFEYAIHKNQIYYVYHKRNLRDSNYCVMNLDGTNARRTTIRPSARHWQSTTRGYYVSIRKNYNNGTTATVLKTPKGTYKLGTGRMRMYN